MIKLTDILNELDQETAYSFKKGEVQYDDADDSLLAVDYSFSTPQNKYKATLYSGEYLPEDKIFVLSFGVDRGMFNALDTSQMSGEGNVRAIIKTLADIIDSFLKDHKNEVQRIDIEGTDEKRRRVYKALFPKYLSPSTMAKVKIYESFHGELITKSQYHSVYQDSKNRDRVIKTGDAAIEHGKLFQKFPKYCPIVYEIHEDAIPTENYIVIEKLETEKAARDFEKLINQDRGYIHNWGYNTFKNNKSYEEVKDRLTTDKGRKMLDRVRDIVLAIGMKDIHARNFGYDKRGNLKALDI